jgi:hypothetical protein
MQVEEGRGASSWRRAAAAASTPSVSSHAQRKPRRPRQEVCRAATCAREEVRGSRGGSGGEDGRDMGKKTVAAWGIPAAGGGNRGRGARRMLKREERWPRAAAFVGEGGGEDAKVERRWPRRRGSASCAPRPQAALPPSDPLRLLAGQRARAQVSVEVGVVRWSAAAGLGPPSSTELPDRAGGERRGSPGPPTFAARKPRRWRVAPPYSARSLASARTGRKRRCSSCTGTEEVMQRTVVRGKEGGGGRGVRDG